LDGKGKKRERERERERKWMLLSTPAAFNAVTYSEPESSIMYGSKRVSNMIPQKQDQKTAAFSQHTSCRRQQSADDTFDDGGGGMAFNTTAGCNFIN